MGILIGLITSLLIPLAFVAVIVAGMWKVFTKAGQPGWASIVPIYNVYVLTIEIAKKEILWFILWLIPLVNIVPAILIPIELAKKFGKDTAWCSCRSFSTRCSGSATPSTRGRRRSRVGRRSRTTRTTRAARTGDRTRPPGREFWPGASLRAGHPACTFDTVAPGGESRCSPPS